MKRLASGALGLALVAAFALLLGSSNAEGENPSIKDIMTKAHKGADSHIQQTGKELKGDQPNWTEVQKHTKELVKLGGSLGKNKPPKGEKDSWDKLTSQYVTTAKALDDAAEKKDKTGALASHKKITGMCATCHSAHKGK